MAACAQCGAKLVDGATTCPGCGKRVRDRPSVETLPLGSPDEPPSIAKSQEDSTKGTLALGSGVPLDGRIPLVARRAARKPSSRPPPAAEAPRAKPGAARAAHGPRVPPRALEKRIEVPKSTRPIARPKRRRPAETRDPEPVAPPLSSRLSTPRARLAVGSVLTVIAVLGLIGVLVLIRPGGGDGDVRGHVAFDRTGRPQVELVCVPCPDGTEARIHGRTATFSNSRAVADLEPPVSVGELKLPVALRRPGREFKNFELVVPVSWVVSADLRGLAQPAPKLSLVFEVKNDVGIIVDGHALAPTPNGTRRYDVDVSADVTGQSATVGPLVRRVPYIVTEPGRPSARSEIEFVTDIVPLRIDAPGESAVLEGASFMLAGITQSGGTVTVEGRPITVDPSGRFAQLMSVSAIGDTLVSVRASAPGQAPRLVPIRVKRVASLGQEAARFATQATQSYAAIAGELEKKIGWKVALEGKIVETKIDGYATTALLDVEKGCGEKPCLVRLSIGARTTLVPGEATTAYGYVAGKTSDPRSGRMIPEVRVEFMRGKK